MIEEILIIKIDSIFFAIETGSIDQILRNLPTTPVAFSPYETIGLCATGGKIVTLLDMGRLMKLPDINQEALDVRLLTLSEPHQSVALLCSSVVDTVEVNQSQIEYLDQSDDAICAIYKFNEEIVQVIDLAKMLSSLQRTEFSLQPIHENLQTGVEDEQSSQNYTRYLVIKMSDERYAIEIEHLKEILILPNEFAKVAGAPSSVLGMMSLRESLLNVLDLRLEYGLEATFSEQNRILVTAINNQQIGLVVDEIVEIREFDNALIDNMPEQFKDELIEGVIFDGTRLVSIIGHETLWQLIKKSDLLSDQDEVKEDAKAQESAIEVVIFSLANEEYAFPIEHVAEIIDNTDVTPVVNTDPFVEGVINIRGQVVSIGSLGNLLSLSTNIASESKIVVTYHNDERIGFRVDHVNSVSAINHSQIKASEKGNHTSILHLDDGNRLVQLIDIAQLIEQTGEHDG